MSNISAKETKPDNRGVAVLTLFNGTKLRSYVEIFLPNYERNGVVIYAYPNKSQYDNIFKYRIESMKLVLRDMGGKIYDEMTFKGVHATSGDEAYITRSMRKCSVIIEAQSCFIEHKYMAPNNVGVQGNAYFSNYSGIFSPSSLSRGHERIELKNIDKRWTIISKEFRFRIKNIFDYPSEHKFISRKMIEYKIQKNSAIEPIERLLNVISFATRRRLLLFKLTEWRNNRFYTSYFSRPKNISEKDNEFNLIDDSNFIKFVKHAYHRLHLIDNKDLYYALNKLNSFDYTTLEKKFMSIYSALESVINFLYFKNNIDPLKIDKTTFSSVRGQFKKNLAAIGIERQLIKSMMSSFNIINNRSIGDKFNEICNLLELDVSDLWPISGESGLSSLRNKFMHGYNFDQSTYRALIGAAEHLRWTLERLFLRIIEWPVELSAVGKKALEKMCAYNELKDDLAIFTGSC